VSETLTVLVPDVSMYQQAGNGTASIARINPNVALNVSPEIDTLQINANAGTFTLSFNGNSTAPLANNISTADLAFAIGNLPGIGLQNVTVTGNDNGPYTITFASQLGPVIL